MANTFRIQKLSNFSLSQPYRWVMVCLLVCLASICSSELLAQQEALPIYKNPQGELPIIAAQRSASGYVPTEYFQPIELSGPQGVFLSIAVDGKFTPLKQGSIKVAFNIGPSYRFRVANIPNLEGVELFPTVQVIDRTYPPNELRWKYPIPVQIDVDDLRRAAQGKFVTKVVYIEHPEAALPVAQLNGEVRWFDAGSALDPLAVADTLGRPVAILRIGGRLPDDRNGPDLHFMGTAPMSFPETEGMQTQIPSGTILPVANRTVPATQNIQRPYYTPNQTQTTNPNVPVSLPAIQNGQRVPFDISGQPGLRR